MIRYIIGPLIGAVIGYATNWIAVKMLFRPHHEVRVFGWKLPFTPGVIPKGQGRLARAVGRAVEEQLLTIDVLSDVLLSEEMKDKIRQTISQWMKKQEASTDTLKETAQKLLTPEKEEDVMNQIKDQLTRVIYWKLIGMDVGSIVAQKVLEAAKEKLAESMFGMMIGGSMLEPIAEMVGGRINEYIADNGEEIILSTVTDETEKLGQKTIGETVSLLENYEIDYAEMAVKTYESMVTEKLPQAMLALNLSKIVEDRINAMDVAEVEELLLSIMKKELGAIVNLGALIGFVLGLVNVAVLLI